MYKPNYVGTPHIYTDDLTSSNAAWIPAVHPVGVANWATNVINAIPAQQFGANHHNWNGTPIAIGTGDQYSLTQQFVLQEPPNANTIGVEVMASITLLGPLETQVRPIIGRLASAPGSILASAEFVNVHTMSQIDQYYDTADTLPIRQFYYRENVVLRAPFPSTWAHGFMFTSDEGQSMQFFDMNASFRVGTSQNNIRYYNEQR